jgi:uncharacterized damage-inducible protein DinB
MISSLQRLVRTPYFDTYLNHLTTDDLLEALAQSEVFMIDVLKDLNDQDLQKRYAEEKWTIAEVVHHIIETEMIFNYRALRIAREQEHQDIEGFDENKYVEASHLEGFSVTELIQFFKAQRQSTMLLLKTFTPEQLQKTGLASGKEVQTEALFYITAGHTIHHAKVILERYL